MQGSHLIRWFPFPEVKDDLKEGQLVMFELESGGFVGAVIQKVDTDRLLIYLSELIFCVSFENINNVCFIPQPEGTKPA